MKINRTEERDAFHEGSIPDTEKRGLSGKSVIVLLALAMLLSVIVSFSVGRYPVGIRELAGILLSKVPFAETEPFWTSSQSMAVWNVRLPRILLAVLVGASLSAAGAAYQGVFQNPIASPDILGASAGAGFGAAMGIYFDLNSTGVTAAAFLMSLTAVAFVFVIGSRVKGEKTLGLVLAGIMISSLFQSGTSFIKLIADPNNKLPAITYWLMGSLAGADKADLKFVIWPVLVGMIPLFLLRWRINVITMGDGESRAMGVDAGKVRMMVVFSASLLTASAVSVSGMIGWVGLIVPHMMRRLVGSDYRILLPASVLAGGTFLLLVDDLSRNLASAEIPIGIMTAIIGAPLFLLLITRRDTWHD